MRTELVRVGFDNFVAKNWIVKVVSPKSQPIKRLIRRARQEGVVIDATHKRSTKSVLITDQGFLILTYLSPDKILERLGRK